MKPMIDSEVGVASCEFCGKDIAKIEGRGNKKNWVKVPVNN